MKKLKKNNIKIVYDTDDDLLNIDENHVVYEEFSKLASTIEYMLSNCDIITVSTDNLKKQLSRYSENITVLPNTLMKIWDFKPVIKNSLKSKKTIKIGYFGSYTHEKDVELIKDAIENVGKYFTKHDIVFEVIGACYKNQNWINPVYVPSSYSTNPTFKDNIKNKIIFSLNNFGLMKRNLAYCTFVQWMKNEINWDIAVAPLEKSNINSSKSNLKYLEYSAMNIPCIYSDVGPYKEIKDKKTGLVVENKTECWSNAIINLIEDEKLYESILKNAYDDIKQNYMVDNASSIWKKILDEI